jgi:hypothetical protein
MNHFKTLRGLILASLTAAGLLALLVACANTTPAAPVEVTPVTQATEALPTAVETVVTTSAPTTVTLQVTDSTAAAQKALAWLRSQQSITDSSYVSSEAASIESLLAVEAAGEDATTWRPAAGASSLLDFVLAHGAEYSHKSTAEAGKLAVALSAAGACWPTGALKPSDFYSPTLGALSADGGPLAWGIIGTLALSEPVPSDSVEYLRGMALPSGGWEWSPGWGHDTNSTALALQALAAAGVPLTDTAIISGEAYLDSAKTQEGGYNYDPNSAYGTDADSNSTAYVLQALKALEVAAPDQAVAFLLKLQGPDGALGWQTAQPAPNLGSTQQAIPALVGQSYPIKRVALKPCQ